MSQYEYYTLILCTIVFVALTALFSTLLVLLVRSMIRLIRTGNEDEKILQEVALAAKKKSKVGDLIAKIFNLVVCLAFCALFAFSLTLNLTESRFSEALPSLKVVKSSSMSYRNEKNLHLFRNNLTNQIEIFDLIVTQPLPAEEELKLYDVVVYEFKDSLIIHRIVGIEPPNEQHPNETRYWLQGDASETRDRYSVSYSQMRGIYHDERVPFVGSFISFMQSPAGYLCILLTVFAIVAAPLLEKKLAYEKMVRLQEIRGMKKEKESDRDKADSLLQVPMWSARFGVSRPSGWSFSLNLAANQRGWFYPKNKGGS